VSYIRELKDVNGMPLTVAEKTKLIPYIFTPEQDGQTKFQKEYVQNYKNLVTSAYYTMMGEKVNEKISKSANSEAAKNLKKKLDIAKGSSRTKNSDNALDQDYGKRLDTLSSILSKPNFN
jgi:hypothetical protein